MKLLAIESSTDVLALAVQNGTQVFEYTGEGGAQTSHSLLPQLRALMAQAGLRFEALDAIAFGRGPGSFTGLRSACAIAQGLGFAAGVRLLPVDTLAALAQQAHSQTGAAQVLVTLDARMGEVYVGYYSFDSWLRNEYDGKSPISPKNLAADAVMAAGTNPVWIGNAFAAYEGQWASELLALERIHATPSASAMLQLAPALIAAGQLVDAEHALPLYSRDKVALTTAEREAVKTASAA